MDQFNFSNPIFAFVLGLIIGFGILYFLSEIKHNCWVKNDAKKELDRIIKILAIQAARWSIAAEGDQDPIIATLHANYGISYWYALNEIATPEQIMSVVDIDWHDVNSKIKGIQRKTTMTLAGKCPLTAPKPSALTRLSGEGI